MLTGSLDKLAVKFRVLFGLPNWCTNVLETEAQVAGSNLTFALISLFLGVVLNFPLSYQNKSLEIRCRINIQMLSISSMRSLAETLTSFVGIFCFSGRPL